MTNKNTEKNTSVIKFKHLRNYTPNSIEFFGNLVPFGEKVSNLGGVTLAFFEKEDGNFSVGAAVCSKKDNFQYARGREIAVERLQTKPATLTPDQLDQLVDVGNALIEIGADGANALIEQTGLQLWPALIH